MKMLRIVAFQEGRRSIVCGTNTFSNAKGSAMVTPHLLMVVRAMVSNLIAQTESLSRFALRVGVCLLGCERPAAFEPPLLVFQF